MTAFAAKGCSMNHEGENGTRQVGAHRVIRCAAIGAVWLALALIAGACGGSLDEPAADPSDGIAQGAELYEEQCASCHGGETGGAISDRPPPHNANGHTWHHPDCLLADITLRGAAAWGADPSTSAMPAFAGTLTEAEVEAILSYMKTWWTDEQRAFQADVTARNCLD